MRKGRGTVPVPTVMMLKLSFTGWSLEVLKVLAVLLKDEGPQTQQQEIAVFP